MATRGKLLARQILEMDRDLGALRSLLKTDGGRLTPAGRAVVRQGIQSGMQQAALARLLEITPAAVSYHK
jgi:hypothetical protein